MRRHRVVILGSSGMLGSMVLDLFATNSEFEVVATCREGTGETLLRTRYPRVAFRWFDAEKATVETTLAVLADAEWAINAIGLIKPYIHDHTPAAVQRAVLVNAYYPYLLAEAAEQTGTKIIQIATDCVYSGQEGGYSEKSPHDAVDVYGKTKSLGEVSGERFYNLRCSIVGPELNGHYSLMDWFLGQPQGTQVRGFTNHRWNGMTTLAFAKICRGIIQNGIDLPTVQHVVPGNALSKAELLETMAEEFKREIRVEHGASAAAVDRTLATKNEALNRKLWGLAGYDTPPSIQTMVHELAEYTRRKVVQE